MVYIKQTDALLACADNQECYDKILQIEPVTSTWKIEINMDEGFHWRKFYCDRCGQWQTYGKTPFCPFCGAAMAL